MNTLEVMILQVGQMQANCYIVTCPQTKECLIIDPGDDAQYITDKISSIQATPIGIVATHGHFDHIMAAAELQLIYSVPFMMHTHDEFLLKRMTETARHFLQHDLVTLPPIVSKTIQDSDMVTVGSHALRIIETPGHTPGSVSLYNEQCGILFVGDVLFQNGGVGRTDHSYCRPLELHDSIDTILDLPGYTIIYPGHGEQTTVDAEMVYHRDSITSL